MDDLRLPGDPQGNEEPHDVLAADEFAMPAHGDVIRARQLTLPEDPTGIAAPHDILAAEDFAMPSGPDRPLEKLRPGGAGNALALLAAAALAVVLYAALRRR
jgi:hypothetical protein